jgi:allantoate deiminase
MRSIMSGLKGDVCCFADIKPSITRVKLRSMDYDFAVKPVPLEGSVLSGLVSEILTRCDDLALLTEETGAITRTFLSYPMKQVHTLLSMWMREAGLTVRIDTVGNVIGRLEGTTDPRTLMIGSHVDTVPNAGKFDGIIGVMFGIALAKALQITGTKLPFALEVIAFSEEEGVRFSLPFIGSRAVIGTLTPEVLGKQDKNGISIEKAISDFGLNPFDMASARAGALLGYLELHIEQGPVLEAKGLALGVVQGIAGQTRATLTLTGKAGHAGTTPMNLRKDALAAAAQVVLEVERFAKLTPGLVATVGMLEVQPGAGNVIPEQVTFSLDVRHLENAMRKRAVAELLDFAWHTARKRDLGFSHEVKLEQASSHCDEILIGFLGDALEDSGRKRFELPSGAGHDAMIMAEMTRTAMLFIRSPSGISHHPSEAVQIGDVRAALDVAYRFITKIATAPQNIWQN